MTKLGFYLEKLSVGLLGLLFLTLPLIAATLTTDTYVLPKQLAVAFVSLSVLLILGVKMLAERGVKIRRTPFDVPVLLFLLSLFLSSVFAGNRAESLTASFFLLFSALLFFLVSNTGKSKKDVLFLLGSFLLGAVLIALNAILSFYKVYLLPHQFTHSQTFTPLGSLLDQAIYLIVALSLTGYLAVKFKLNLKTLVPTGLLSLTFVLTAAGFGFTVYELVKIQNPIILPFVTGFQIAFAAISQDTGRLIQAFLFGSGFGTFATDFSRFKQAAFNQTPYWNLTFFRSSSWVLELLATVGILGFASYLFLVYKILKQKPLFVPLAVFIFVSFVLPLSFATQALLFVLLSIFAGLEGLSKKEYFDVELALVTLKKEGASHGLSRLLPFIVFVVLAFIVTAGGLLTGRFAAANLTFQKSLTAASENKGSEAYQEQSKALALVSYSDAYHRVFSQTNLALANSLSAQTPRGASPSAQTQQTIYTLIQQSINSARTATDLSPQTALNWQNLSSVYRSLIGFGRNADSFAILANQQAVVLDSTNPQEYLNLGGLYYQLQLWDKAVEQFQTAVNLKSDFANGYYNLGHAYEQKGDLKTALAHLKTVKTLVQKDKTNLEKIDREIKDLEKGINTSATLNQPNAALPIQNPPVAIPAPITSPVPTLVPAPAATPSATPTPAAK